MQLTKEYAKQLFAKLPDALARIEQIKGDIVYFDLMDKEQYKTSRQNRLFHGLLQTFFASGCASFDSFDELRLYYKRIAGLVKRNGNSIVEGSWSDASKEQARIAIDMLIRDMDYSGVMGSSMGNKYQSILQAIKQ